MFLHEIVLIYRHFWRWSKSSSWPSALPWHPHKILWVWWMKLKVWSIKLCLQRVLLRSLLTGWDCKTAERLNTLQAESRKVRYFVNESSHLPFYQQHRAHAGRCQLWNLTRVVLLYNRDISSWNLSVLSERLSVVMYFQIRKGLGFQSTRTLP